MSLDFEASPNMISYYYNHLRKALTNLDLKGGFSR